MININEINNLLDKADEVINNNEVIVEEVKTDLLMEDATPDNKTNELMKKVNEKLEIIKDLEGINIEKIGVWLWLDGNTKEYKSILKEAGFRYASKKQMWYYNPDDTYRRRSWSTSYSKEEMEALHGYEIIK